MNSELFWKWFGDVDRQFISLKGIVYVCEYACVCVSRSVVSDQAPLPTRVCVCVCVCVCVSCSVVSNSLQPHGL